MYQSPADLQAPLPPVTVAPDPPYLIVPPQRHPCHALLTELLICVMHRELSQESNHERQD
jgi:hypothetical protein